MVKSFRFLLQFTWVNLGALCGFAAIVVAGCYITGVPQQVPEGGNMFLTYFYMFPTMILMCLFLFAFALCTSNLNLGISMGARRRDFFWAIQGNILFCALVCWVLQIFMTALPAVANWASYYNWTFWTALAVYGGTPFPALCVSMMVLGCLGGLVMVKSRILGTIVITISVLLLMSSTIMTLLSSTINIVEFFDEPWRTWLWVAAPKILAGTLIAATVGGEFLIWRFINRYTVR